MTERQHTKDRLADALRSIPGVPEDMIQRAAEGYYHDYLTPLPALEAEKQLIGELRKLIQAPGTPHASRLNLQHLIRLVIDGEYDPTVEEGDEWEASPQGQETMRRYGMTPRSHDGHQA